MTSLINEILYGHYWNDNDKLIEKMGWTNRDTDEYGWYQFRLLTNLARDIDNLKEDIKSINEKLGTQSK